ncbi:hypothetical protein C7Y71_003130 [Pseudoprevotella muciniphila]|uniref:Uncharacterized protein n=1 Tax=Pseudoprevotella muciniphila TaxID=2133944 RepID=A0A5P8E510_9BACT|nr:hypothetical protein [Pseudoprevotella muciniphila]QFQ12093.1 hypothetical protein C7Y71_003130 [Pseudoprevotella muciniphila]
MKQSFLSKIIGGELYDDFKSFSKIIVVIGSCVITIVFVFSLLFYWEFIRSLLHLFIGNSILFALYIGAIIILLDKEVEVEDNNTYAWEKKSSSKPKTYNFTIAWGIILIVLGICAIYVSNLYRKHYDFQCNSFLVDESAKVYHLDFDNDCEIADETGNLIRKQGFQIDETYSFCDWCEEWAEDSELEYESNKYFRK